MEGVYLTWMISALALGVLLMPVFKPPWAKISLATFVDFFRRYWVHILIVFFIYNAKDTLDQVDRILAAVTGGDMTPWIWAVEGNMVLWVQETFKADWLTVSLTHFYVAGFMFICYVSIFYMAYFDDRYMADRVTLSIAWVYFIAVPFYLFFNVRVTGDTIPGMETLAYNLTPEIEDWFRRIDPFSNAMPSLHIGVPFAVWLCLTRFDEDGRWNRYRHVVLTYVVLTAFTIVYLGIHWFLDIIGGMLVAAAAVHLADRTAGPVWKIFDERTMNARIVTVLTRPDRAFSLVKNRISSTVQTYKRPKAHQTGVIAVVLLLLATVIITWDLTHQALPAGGVVAPEGVAAADGWMVTMDNRSEGAQLIATDLSDLETPIEVVQPVMQLDSPYAISGTYLAMANSTQLILVDLQSPQEILLDMEIDSPDEIYVSQTPTGPVTLTLTDGVLQGYDWQGFSIAMPLDLDNVSHVIARGTEMALVSADEPCTVHLAGLTSSGSLQIKLNASAAEEQELVMASWGVETNLSNSTIVDLVFDSQYIAASINVTSTDRLVVYERSTGEQWIVGDPKYPVFDPSVGHGILAWSVRDHLDPSNPQTQYMDGEIYFMNLQRNLTDVLTSDEIEQWGPQVLENHLVYFEMDEDGITTVKVHSWEPELNTYSSAVLQVITLAAIIMVFIHVWQRQKEARVSQQ